MIYIAHSKGDASPPTPPPATPDSAAKDVERTLLTGRRKRMGYEQTILTLGGNGQNSNNNLGGGS